MSRGQVQSQVFTYIFGLVIVGIVLLLGYTLVTGLGRDVQEINTKQVQTDLESIIRSASQEYGSMHKEKVPVPDKFTQVCFVKSDVKNINPADIPSDYPLIADSVRSATDKNVFLMDPKLADSFFIDNLVVDGTLLCIENSNGITFRVEGLGNLAKIYDG